MLNRRTLRVKALQALFAYVQCKEANFNVSLGALKDSYEPNLNSMEEQDREELKVNQKEAEALFKEHYADKISRKKLSENNDLQKAVKEHIKEYQEAVEKDKAWIRKKMLMEAEGIYDNFIRMLNLILHFSSMAREGVGMKKSEKDAQKNFADNKVVALLREDKQVETLTLKKNLGWQGQKDMIRDWFRNIITKDDSYIEYISHKDPDLNQDYEIVNYIIRKIVFKNKTITSHWENEDLSWVENAEIIRSLVNKTLKSIVENDNGYELATLSYNWDEDMEFFGDLFDQTIAKEDFLKDLVAQKTKNWEFDRIAFTDRLILMMAVAEMMHFPNIPVKVSINEYIELSKNYSTPKSKQFVNGVLDVIAVDLQKQGLIKKSGRGLIDNR